MKSLISLILFFSFYLFTFNVKATTYYWIGGPGNWNNTSNWSLSSGSVAASAIPNSTDDVIFDNNSGLGTSNGTFPITISSNSCRNMTFSLSVTTATAATINFTGASRFDLFGDLTVNLPSSVSLLFDNSDFRFQLPTAGLTKTITNNIGNKLIFNNILYFDNTSSGTINFNGLFYNTLVTSSNAVTVSSNIALGAPTVTVNFDTKPIVNSMSCYNSLVNFNAGYKKLTLNNNTGLTVQNTSTVNITADSEFGAVYFAGKVKMSNINVDMVSLTGGIYSTSTLDISNSTITLQGGLNNNNGTWIYNTPLGINTTNSKLIFPNGANIFATGGNYNYISINEVASERYTIPSGIQQGIEADSLIIDTEISLNGNIKINSLIQIMPGHNCTGQFANVITANSTVTTSIAGACQKPNLFRDIQFTFQPGSHLSPYLIADYLILDGTTITSTITANAGSNSFKVVNTNTTNWIIGTPTPRTLYWIGTIPTVISDSTTYGNWWDSNNWSNNPTASPTNQIGGPQCPPTYEDSVVFPNNSYVNCNLAKQYTKSMLWQRSGQLYSGINNLIQIWGSLEFSAAMTNRFKGTVWFKTYEKYPTITTKVKPFIGGVIFAATSLTGTVATGEWLLKDKLFVPNIDKNNVQNNFPHSYTFNGGSFSAALIMGHLKTGIDANTIIPGIQIDPILSQSSDIECLGFLMEGGSTLSLFNSNFYITGVNLVSYNDRSRYPSPFFINDYKSQPYFNASISSASCNINAGTSNIIFTANNITVGQNYDTYKLGSTYYGPGAFLGKGHKFYDITFAGANATGIVEQFQDTIRKLNFNGGGFLRQYAYWTGYTSSTLNQSGFVSRINFNNPNKLAYFESILDFPNTHTNYQITVDSLYFLGHGNFINIDVKLRSILFFSPGYSYEIKNGQNIELVNSVSGTNYPYPYKQTSTQINNYNFTNGGTINSVGTCTSNISITGGNFIGNSTMQTVHYNIITNNTFSGTGYNYLHSVLSGTTTGWIGTPDLGRKLHWKDNSGIIGNINQWNNSNNWEEIYANGTLKFAAPQCPPTRIDTVIFDSNSFSASNQVVQVNLGSSVAECYSMYWGNTPFSITSSSLTPKFDALPNQKLYVFGNLQFNSGMTQNFQGPITFKGPYDFNFGGSGSYNYIESAGKAMYPPITFEADIDTKRWELKDDIKTVVMPSSPMYTYNLGHFNFWRGVFDSKGKNMEIGNFNSVSNTYRRLILNNSQVTINYPRMASTNGYQTPDWNVDGISSSSLFHIDAGISNIITKSFGFYFCGGGHKYHNITNPTTSPTAYIYIAGTGHSYIKDTFNIVTNQKNTTPLVFGISVSDYSYNPDSLIIHKVTTNGDFTCFSNGNKIDSLIMYGNGNIYTNNIFNNLLQFTPNKTYLFGSNKVQWIKNSGKFYPIGTIGNHIQFYSTTTGIPAYVRKDSGYVCADYIFMKDIWGIGNGNNIGSCTSGTVTGINTNCPPTLTNPWIVSSCDTITNYTSSCGPFQAGNPITYSRGRADFNGGPSADYLSDISGWAKNPYPALPKFTLTSITPSVICQGDSILASFSGVGSFPMHITYTSSIGSSVLTFTSNSQVSSYNSSNSSFTYTTYIKPITSGTISAVNISIERCFNSDTLGTGSFVYKVNPKPEFTSFSKHVLCKGTSTGIGYVVPITSGTPIYNYNWGSTYPNNDSIIAPAGNYTCFISDASGCKDTITLSITEPTSSLSVSVSSGTTICSANTGTLTTTVTGGWSSTYTFLWQSATNPTLATTSSVTSLPAGNYTVIVTDTGNCVITKYTTITPPILPTITSVASNSINCFGQATGSSTIIVTPGSATTYSTNWVAPSTYTGSTSTFTSNSLTNLSSGNYSVTVTDIYGCAASTVITIAEPTSSVAIVLSGSVTPTNCSGNTGIANITSSGGLGSGYIYIWTNSLGTSTTSVLSNTALPSGNTSVTAIDGNGCSSSSITFSIIASGSPTVSVATNSTQCYGTATGSAVATVIGTAPFSYTWQSSVSHTNSSDNLSAGIYTVIVNETSTGCITIASFTISEISAITTSVTSILNAKCFEDSTGAVSLNTIGGTPSYTYNWLPYGGSTNTATNLAQGIYTVTVTDNNNCMKTNTVQILGVNQDLNIVITDTVKPECKNPIDGSITISVTGGTPNYSYLWNNGNTSATNSNLANATYTLIVTDANNCTKQLEITLDCYNELFIPELFSPNADNQNDKFEIIGIENYPDNKLTIFNRWGNLIFEREKYNNDWDGKPNVNTGTGSELLPSGTYFVIFEYGDNKSKTYKGFVQLDY